MPPFFRFLLEQSVIGVTLGIVFLSVMWMVDPFGLAALIARSADAGIALTAAAISALGLLVLAFIATGLEFRSQTE